MAHAHKYPQHSFLILGALSVALAACSSAPPKKSPCEIFQSGLAGIEKQNPVSSATLTFTPPPMPVAEKFDPAWSYFEQDGFFIPLPSKPDTVKRNPNGNVVVQGDHYTLALGADHLPESTQLAPFLEKQNLRSGYDLYGYVYEERYLTCADVESDEDAVMKGSLGVLKSLKAPFKVERAWRSPGSEAVVRTGPNELNDRFITNVFLGKGKGGYVSALLMFAREADQAQFHSYVARLREKAFFAPGKRLKL